MSVLNQGYDNLEYIIIDGGSTDNSVDIIKKYQSKLAFWVSEKDNGQSEAINKGFKIATGDIIAWLNSDDLYLPNTFDDLSKLYEECPDISVFYADVLNFSENTKEYITQNQFELYDFFSRVSLHQPSIFWRRSALNEVGLLDENLHFCMDYDLWMRLFLNYKSLKVNKIYSKFRIHNSSKTNNDPIELYKEYQIVICKFFNSIHEKQWVQKLKINQIYFNTNNDSYSINYRFKQQDFKKILDNYIKRSIYIEYTKKNYRLVTKLFVNNPILFLNIRNCILFLKNKLKS